MLRLRTGTFLHFPCILSSCSVLGGNLKYTASVQHGGRLRGGLSTDTAGPLFRVKSAGGKHDHPCDSVLQSFEGILPNLLVRLFLRPVRTFWDPSHFLFFEPVIVAVFLRTQSPVDRDFGAQVRARTRFFRGAFLVGKSLQRTRTFPGHEPPAAAVAPVSGFDVRHHSRCK